MAGSNILQSCHSRLRAGIQWIPIIVGMALIAFCLFVHPVFATEGLVPGAGEAVDAAKAAAAAGQPLTEDPDNCYYKGDYTVGAFLDLAQNIIKYIFGISGALALLMFIYGGFLWLISMGESKRTQQGQEVLIQASTGLAIIFCSWLLVNFVVATLTNKSPSTAVEIFAGKPWNEYDATMVNGVPTKCLTAYWDELAKKNNGAAPAPATTPGAGATAGAVANATECDVAVSSVNSGGEAKDAYCSSLTGGFYTGCKLCGGQLGSVALAASTGSGTSAPAPATTTTIPGTCFVSIKTDGYRILNATGLKVPASDVTTYVMASKVEVKNLCVTTARVGDFVSGLTSNFANGTGEVRTPGLITTDVFRKSIIQILHCTKNAPFAVDNKGVLISNVYNADGSMGGFDNTTEDNCN